MVDMAGVSRLVFGASSVPNHRSTGSFLSLRYRKGGRLQAVELLDERGGDGVEEVSVEVGLSSSCATAGSSNSSAVPRECPSGITCFSRTASSKADVVFCGGRRADRRRPWSGGSGLRRFLTIYLRPYTKRREILASKRPGIMLTTGLRVRDRQPSRPCSHEASYR